MKRIVLWIGAMLVCAGCGSGRQGDGRVQRLIGQKIVFSDSLLASTRLWMSDSLRLQAVAIVPKILVCVTAQECNLCQMHIPQWNIYMRELRRWQGKVPVVFVVAEQPEKAVPAVRNGHCPATVLTDPDSEFWEANNLPVHPIFNTFLLDGDNRIVLVGSPIGNAAMWKLYRSAIDSLRADGERG